MGHRSTDPPMPGDAGRGRTAGSVAYGVATGVAAAIAVVVAGADPEIAAGIVCAWILQWFAVRALGSALDEGRDATRAWLGGLAARGLGLAAAGGLMLAGRASEALPIAYGAAMCALLMAEAAWLIRRLPARGGPVDPAPAHDVLQGTGGAG